MIKKFVSMAIAVLLMASGISFIGTTTASAVDVWTSRTSVDENAGWRSVAYGAGLWVAVASSGTNRVMTSPDGITWTGRTHTRNLSWRSVAYGNDLWVAVGSDVSNLRVITSPDGITWTERTAAAENFWRSVAFGNNLFVAVATSGTNRVMTAPPTITPPTTTSSTPTPTAAEIAAAAAAAGQAFGEGLRLRKMISARQNLSSAFLGGKSGSIDDFRDANITVTTTASLIRINAEILKLSELDRIDFAKIKVLAERIEFDESFFNAAARPAASTYATYGVAGVTDRILAKVNAQVLELPGAQRLDTKAITEIANVESFIDRVANTETRASVSASLLISKGLVPADYPKKHSLIQGLGSYPEDNLNTMAEIQAAIKAEIAKAQAPRLRTAEIKARIAARNK